MNTSRKTCGEIAELCLVVIASAAKQSTYPLAAPWIASLTLAMTLRERRAPQCPAGGPAGTSS
jgi:hypothetical protein